jgi:hypothetical protein
MCCAPVAVKEDVDLSRRGLALCLISFGLVVHPNVVLSDKRLIRWICYMQDIYLFDIVCAFAACTLN